MNGQKRRLQMPKVIGGHLNGQEKTDADAEGDWWSSEWPEKTDAEAEGDWWSSKWPDATPDKSWM